MSPKRIYIDPYHTPLKYLRFQKALLPIAVIASLIRIALLFVDNPYLLDSWYGWHDLILFTTVFGLILGATIGLSSMEWYGVKCLLGLQVLFIVDEILIFVLAHMDLLPSSMEEAAIAQILCSALHLFLLWVYFEKRRLLFDPPPAGSFEPEFLPADPQHTAPEPAAVHTPPAPGVSQSASAVPKVQFCRRCGFRLLEDSNFCSCCGTAVMTEATFPPTQPNG